MSDHPDLDRAAIDGIAALDGTVVAFGRDHGSGAITVWTSDDASWWQRSTVEGGVTAESPSARSQRTAR
ncbi:MAG TPA: hypothetical protein VFZ70_08600 [Euzebyales bacterium]